MNEIALTVCENCIFWKFVSDKNGICKRNSPRPETLKDGEKYTVVYPTTQNTDGCGDGKSRS
jgi:hypothetical protein